MTEPGNAFTRFWRHNLPAGPWQFALIALLGSFAAVVMLLALIALLLTPTLPPIDDLAQQRLKVPMRVYTADGELIAEFGEEKRIPVTIEQVPETLIQAILSAEDHSFFYHQGVDFLGLARAAWANLRAQRTAQGGSTITMQVARNYFLSPEKTYTRKLREVLLAFKLERELSKKEILTLYLNKIFLGHRAYGFAAAAQVYFGKTLHELTLAETALLAGLPKAPSRDNPLTNPANALERRNTVLRQMHKLGYVKEPALKTAVAAPLTASKHALRYDLEAPYVAEMVRQYMIGKYDENTYSGGFHVYTTINAKHQRAALRALRRGLLDYEHRHGYRGPAGRVKLKDGADREAFDEALKDYRVVGELVPGVVQQVEEQSAAVYTQDGVVVTLDWAGLSWARLYVDENAVGPAPKRAADVLRVGDIVYLEPPDSAVEGGYWRLAPVPRVGGALVALRPNDGAVLALVGGFDFTESSYNRVIQAERQPGSSIKPFIYSAALDKGFTPATTVSGAPIVLEGESPEDEWRPEDYSRRFYGPTRLREALAKSLNLVSVRLLRAIGAGYAVEYLARFGFESQKMPRNLSLALGTASATPMQMASAFAVFANGGYRVTPYFIARVEDADHKVLERAAPRIAAAAAPTAEAQPAEAVLSPETAFLMTSMMRDVIREGTAKAALDLKRTDLAGKTGTTNEYRDAWFSGFNGDLVATAWIGFDQPASLGRGETGGRAALPIWMDYMRVALDGLAEKPLVPPPTITKALVNRETGLPTAAGDPQAIEEYFAPGTESRTTTVDDDAPAVVPPSAPPAPVPDNIRRQIF
jgi:penicillin-binding protein 1A